MMHYNDNYHFEDFTETSYRHQLQIIKNRWEFIDFPSYKSPGRVCLWRHDLDFSIQRAFRLAQIEAEEQIQATYFILLHSEFYNPLEKAQADLISRIIALGHNLGLHFDPGFYAHRLAACRRSQIIHYM